MFIFDKPMKTNVDNYLMTTFFEGAISENGVEK